MPCTRMIEYEKKKKHQKLVKTQTGGGGNNSTGESLGDQEQNNE